MLMLIKRRLLRWRALSASRSKPNASQAGTRARTYDARARRRSPPSI